MKFRALFIMFLLLGQPFAAFAEAWDSPPEAGVMGHCETADDYELVVEDTGMLPDTGETHSDCDEECGLCAGCASVLNVGMAATAEPVRAGDQTIRGRFLPTGVISPLYRPPIVS